MSKITGIDNRAGDNDEGIYFGFVYINDTRVGFCTGNGVWPALGWRYPTQREFDAARKALNDMWPDWNKAKVTS